MYHTHLPFSTGLSCICLIYLAARKKNITKKSTTDKKKIWNIAVFVFYGKVSKNRGKKFSNSPRQITGVISTCFLPELFGLKKEKRPKKQ